MNPDNLPCLAAARPDVCVLANNHVLDFGRAGLAETLGVLAGAGLAVAGAGLGEQEACQPAVVPVAGGGRVVVLALGAPSSGIPPAWAAVGDRSGVALVPELSPALADEVAARARRARRPGDVVVVSLHWGGNWGYAVGDDQIHFAHRLVDGGVDIVHGHSSHHPRPVEVYRDRLILYGCGDFIDDYEGIGGYESYRDDLRLAFFVSVEAGSGALAGLRIVPLQTQRLALRRANPDDVAWLRETLDRISSGFGARFEAMPPGHLELRQAPAGP
jgi:poly-gamma-glutamate synthesis protein (capsule biosynthesis protein)